MKIINLISIFFISLFFTSNTYSQSDTTKSTTSTIESENYVPKSEFRTFRMGIYAGLGFSWMKPKTKDYTSQGSVFAYHYGLITDYNFTENYTLSTGFAISSYGGKLTYKDSCNLNDTVPVEGMYNRTYSISSFEIPIMIKMKTNQMGYFTYFAQLGIRNYLRLGSTYDETFAYDDNGATKTIITDDYENSEEMSFYNMAFSFGLGAEYAISKSFSAFGYVSYNNGLINVMDRTNTYSSNKENAVIRNFTLTAGFLF